MKKGIVGKELIRNKELAKLKLRPWKKGTRKVVRTNFRIFLR